MNLYLHFPFCGSKCGYCTFASFFGNNEQKLKYVELLKAEVKSRLNELKQEVITTIYCGGGTPSKMGGNFFIEFFTWLRGILNLENLKEFTVECNPEDITEDLLIKLKQAGVNRISVGVQSFDDNILLLLQRNSNNEIIKKALNLISKSDLKWSLDLIFGIRNQTINSFKSDLNTAFSYNPHHLSCYELMIDEKSVLGRCGFKENEEQNLIDFYKLRDEEIKTHGYLHYEISNFSLGEDNRCKHNYDFWLGCDYIGLGLSAVSCVGNIVRKNSKTFHGYEHNKFEKEIFNPSDIFDNFIHRRFRILDGLVSRSELEKFGHLGLEFWEKFINISRDNPDLFVTKKDSIKLSEKGSISMNEILESIL